VNNLRPKTFNFLSDVKRYNRDVPSYATQTLKRFDLTYIGIPLKKIKNHEVIEVDQNFKKWRDFFFQIFFFNFFFNFSFKYELTNTVHGGAGRLRGRGGSRKFNF
jgi:hypothetical protein